MKKRWNDVIVYDYREGRQIAKLDLPPESIPGEVHYSPDGRFGVVEEVDAQKKYRKAIHIFKLKNLKWQKKAYQ